MPVYAFYSQIGFHGFIKSTWDNTSFIQPMCLGLTFEGIFRMTLHLLDIPILQIAHKGDVIRYKYRMLTTRLGGLINELNFNRLLKDLPPDKQDNAKQVIFLAVKARDALAHGALLSPTEERWKGEAHLFIKAIQLLESVGLMHMRRESAYYQWLARKKVEIGGENTQSLADWENAELYITEKLNSILNKIE